MSIQIVVNFSRQKLLEQENSKGKSQGIVSIIDES
jgi:hypothetical protein